MYVHLSYLSFMAIGFSHCPTLAWTSWKWFDRSSYDNYSGRIHLIINIRWLFCPCLHCLSFVTFQLFSLSGQIWVSETDIISTDGTLKAGTCIYLCMHHGYRDGKSWRYWRYIFGPFWVILGPFWQFGVIFGPLWAILGNFWAILGHFSAIFWC